MNIKMKIAFGCYFLTGLLLAGFGFVYLLRPEFMPYHSVAVGLAWSEVPPQFQVLIIALMRVIGGTCIALLLAIYIILFTAFRNGAKWALWALPLIIVVQSITSFYGMLHVAQHTVANPPFLASAIGLILATIAVLFSMTAKKNTP